MFTYLGSPNVQIMQTCSEYHHGIFNAFYSLTVFPVKLWTPQKISGMCIVLPPIRCEMELQKITNKPQHWLVMTCWEQRAGFFTTRNLQFYLFQMQTFISNTDEYSPAKTGEYPRLVYITQVNSTFRVRWLAKYYWLLSAYCHK